MTPRVSVVIPVYNEGENIVRCLDRILREVLLPAEILVVHDMPEDTTVPYALQIAASDPRVRPVLNTLRSWSGERDPVRHRRGAGSGGGGDDGRRL